MKLGVLTNLFQDKPLEDVLVLLASKDIHTIELGCGGYPGAHHCNPDILLHDDLAFSDFTDLLKKYEMSISALSCHTNPVSPNKEMATENDTALRKAVLLAEKLGVDVVNTFSGCPGDSDTSQYPNWVTCPWPNEFQDILNYQWNDVLIPYWKNITDFSKEHGNIKFAIEIHPGFCVYNTETALRLREVSDLIGVNFDPSHLVWQGIDPVMSIRALGKAGAIFHFHAKDTKIDEQNTKLNGVLDTKSYADEINRSWIFRSVGYGQNISYWKDIISNLMMVGYNGAISIEHEDSLMTREEGLDKAILLLKDIVIKDKLVSAWWL